MRGVDIEKRRHWLYKVVESSRYIKVFYKTATVDVYTYGYVETCEVSIATDDRQYQYNRDYFLGDYVTVQHDRFGLKLPKVQLVGMIESFDQNGYSLTPTFRGG